MSYDTIDDAKPIIKLIGLKWLCLLNIRDKILTDKISIL